MFFDIKEKAKRHVILFLTKYYEFRDKNIKMIREGTSCRTKNSSRTLGKTFRWNKRLKLQWN